MQNDFEQDNGHFLVLVQRRSGIKWYFSDNSPQGVWDHIAEEMLLEFAESGHRTFRATTPLSSGILKSKGHGKLSTHFDADEYTIETFFSHFCQISSVFSEQWHAISTLV